ncbi:MAG TPA: phosphoglycerate dehydrogenase [Planctomycetes bacterium]|nr:phosphoglycerate dehydrogenase [Planctomycetota bacterium]
MTPTTDPNVLIADHLAPAAIETFRRRGIEPVVSTGLQGDALLEAVREADAIVVRSATKVTREVLDAAPRLSVVGRAGIGVDNIDVEAATERGVVVMNTPLGNATTTAELAITLLLALARHIPRADRMVRSGVWKKSQLVGTEITGKTLGVIGLGRIGRIVAERARGLGMRVIAHDPYLGTPKDGESPVPGVELLDLAALLAEVDFLTIHVPLTPGTRGLISWREFQAIKPGARLIQASRGGIVDEEAALDALRSGTLSGAAFDVFSEEPPPKDHPLLAREDVILTPHLGASSAEAQLRVAVDIAEQISDFLLEGDTRYAVNAPTLPPDQRGELGPYLDLARRIGCFLAQRIAGPIRKVELTVAGEIARFDLEHLRLAFLVGVLQQSMEAVVNTVNAPSLARERGILVLEGTTEEARFRAGELRVRAVAPDGGRSVAVAGAVFGRDPRLTEVDGIRLDLALQGSLLVTRHRNVPGVVGNIGTLLGSHGVNIRRVELAPSGSHDGRSMGFLTLEGSGVDERLVAEVNELDGIEEASLLHL